MNQDKRNIGTGSVIAGIIVIGLGIGFLLDNLNIIDFGHFIGIYWPAILIIIGLMQLITKSSSLWGSLILIVVGIVFQLNALQVLPWNVWSILWPILIIVFGIQLIFSRLLSPKPIGNSSNFVQSFVAFGGNDLRNTSTDFKGGDTTAIFGGIKVDLREAKMTQESAEFKVNAIFGGIEMLVPRDWKVEINGLPLFGGWDNKAHPEPEATKTLKINASVMFGGLDVKN